MKSVLESLKSLCLSGSERPLMSYEVLRIIYTFLVAALISQPDGNGAYQFPWPVNFSRNVVPKACHSHSDYWRTVLLYEALAAGCVNRHNDLPVGHVKKVLKSTRSLRTLYIDPLINIFSNRNISSVFETSKEAGVFETDPNALESLRRRGWLTYFNGTDIVPGPVTVVGTGNTPFDLVVADSSHRYVYFDAPLLNISNSIYTLGGGQINTIKTQIEKADAKGLESRYWDTLAWPISFRDRIRDTLVENGVGILNVGDLVSATRWNWDWCVVARLTLCG
ncbi:hypothetical protein V2W45_1466714 [Cenococcum geophilum]